MLERDLVSGVRFFVLFGSSGLVGAVFGSRGIGFEGTLAFEEGPVLYSENLI